ncbi:MAG: archease, partial [Candidatus Diapherotrites archaeon]|nr:archease [Candidatus Diapherotrites archaeon]
KDAQEIVFGKFDVQIKKGKGFELDAKCFGEHIKYPDSRLRNDVKAITKHLFEIKKEKGKFKATVVLDI